MPAEVRADPDSVLLVRSLVLAVFLVSPEHRVRRDRLRRNEVNAALTLCVMSPAGQSPFRIRKVGMKSHVAYWIVTVLLGVAFIGMGLANFLQPGTMDLEIAKSGYPSHFFKLLGVWQVLGGVVVLLPKLPRLKEWAYAGILVNLIAAAHHHYIAGDDVAKITIPLVVLSIAAASSALRPPSRRLQGSLM